MSEVERLVMDANLEEAELLQYQEMVQMLTERSILEEIQQDRSWHRKQQVFEGVGAL